MLSCASQVVHMPNLNSDDRPAHTAAGHLLSLVQAATNTEYWARSEASVPDSLTAVCPV